MRLQKILDYLDRQGVEYTYSENDDCGGIDFIRRGLNYHIWEYPEPERGAASNVRAWGRMEDFEGDYEAAIIEVMADKTKGFEPVLYPALAGKPKAMQ